MPILCLHRCEKSSSEPLRRTPEAAAGDGDGDGAGLGWHTPPLPDPRDREEGRLWSKPAHQDDRLTRQPG